MVGCAGAAAALLPLEQLHAALDAVDFGSPPSALAVLVEELDRGVDLEHDVLPTRCWRGVKDARRGQGADTVPRNTSSSSSAFGGLAAGAGAGTGMLAALAPDVRDTEFLRAAPALFVIGISLHGQRNEATATRRDRRTCA